MASQETDRPPPYDKDKGRPPPLDTPAEEDVSSPPPTFQDATGPQFPGQFTVLRKSGLLAPSTAVLADSGSTPLHHIVLRAGLVHLGKPAVELHSTANERSPIIASATAASLGQSYSVQLGSPTGSRPTVEKLGHRNVLFGGVYSFSLENTGSAGHRHQVFEWHRCKGRDMGDLGLNGRGWKLSKLPSGAGGSGEVVAAWVEAKNGGKNRLLDFRFLGSGLDNSLGDKWALMTVVTAIAIWYRELTDD